MKSEYLSDEDVLTMQKEKGKICVSIIVPTHRLSPERRVDKLAVERAIAVAKEVLHNRYTVSNIKPILHALDELYRDIDFSHNSDGLGLYVSPGIKLGVQFHFPVHEKVMVGDNFEMRDLVYKENYAAPYFVLMLTQKVVRLYKSSWEQLIEMNDANFPNKYEEEYSYSPPSQSTSYAGYAHVKSFEKDKSVLEEIRFSDFFGKIDKMMDDYLAGNTPFILLGTEKDLAWFENNSSHKKNIIKKIAGNYNYFRESQIAEMAWPVMLSHLQQERQSMIKEFREKIGEHLGVNGIQPVWKAAHEGRALTLLVEKDYCKPGFVGEDINRLYLHPPIKPHKTLADAVDEIIETVLGKKGHVVFTDNDLLKDYERIALITRY